MNSTGKGRILNISSYDYGGAGIAAVIINDYLNAAGYSSSLIVRDTDGKTPGVIHYRKKTFPYIAYQIRKRIYAARARRWRHLCRDNRFKNNVVFDNLNSLASARAMLRQAGFIPDLILVHWVHNFVTPEMIADLKRLTGAKIAVMMMDNAGITGGCHYPFSCKGYESDCSLCPLFAIPTDFPVENIGRKLKYLPADLEFWGTTSDCRRARASVLGRNRTVAPVIFPINEAVLPSESKCDLRRMLGIEPETKAIVVGCTTFNAGDNRKGFEYLILSLLSMGKQFPELNKNIELLLVGDNDPGVLDKMGYRVKRFGYLPMKKLMEVYKAADLFISSSVEDSGPLMVNQSIAAGTPVAAFNVGVANDLVIDGKTGVLAPLYDYEYMASKMGELLLNGDFGQINRDCVELFKKKSAELSMLNQVERILNS